MEDLKEDIKYKWSSFISSHVFDVFRLSYWRKIGRRLKLIKTVLTDEDWDYSYVYRLIGSKLKNILKYSQTDTVTYPSEWRPRYIKVAISLCDMLSDGVHGKDVNINNAKRFYDARDLTFKQPDIDESKIHSDIVLDVMTHTDFVQVEKDELYEIKARHLLFKILTNYIGYWWD